MKLIVIFSCLLCSTTVMAQATMDKPQVDLQTIGQDEQGLISAIRHYISDMSDMAREIQSDRAEITRLNSELEKLKPATPSK